MLCASHEGWRYQDGVAEDALFYSICSLFVAPVHLFSDPPITPEVRKQKPRIQAVANARSGALLPKKLKGGRGGGLVLSVSHATRGDANRADIKVLVVYTRHFYNPTKATLS